MAFETGPHLTVAALCERVLQEADGLLSPIRILDRLIVTLHGLGPAPPDDTKLPIMPVWLCLIFKADQARGKETITVRIERPDGISHDAIQQTVLFEGAERGVNIVGELQLQFEQEGLYWFSVFLGEQFVTKIPLRVIVMYQQIRLPVLPLPPPESG